LHEYFFLQQEVGSLSVSAQRIIVPPADATGFGDGKGNPMRDLFIDRNFLEAFPFRKLGSLDDF